ncbi:hypothetical protein A2U01_0057017, partial [Trifolium medium]|nr:hypothetical protein [Trifolium medium]
RRWQAVMDGGLDVGDASCDASCYAF